MPFGSITRAFVLLVALVAVVPVTWAQSSVADSALKAANGLYNAGSYESAELAARRLMEQGPISDSIRIEAERVITFSLVAQGKTDLARDHFELILSIKPAFELDPVLTSPKILAVFSDAKLRSAASRRPGPAVLTKTEPSEPDITFRSVLFPGWEQYYQGRSAAGLVFVGAGVLSLGSAIVFEILRATARKDYLAATQPADIASKYYLYNRYYRGEVYSLVAFAAVYIASEFDVFMNRGRSLEIQPSADPAKGPGLVLSLHW